MNIPIHNIYYMLLYAWDALDQAESLALDAENATTLVDLFGRVLHQGIEHMLRRGIDRGYVPRCDSLPCVRGRIDVSGTLLAQQRRQARAICDCDELSHDVLHNRIVKSAIQRLLRVDRLSDEVRDRLACVYRRLDGIIEVPLTQASFRAVRLNRNNRHYGLLISVCRLLCRGLLVNETAGENEFADFVRDKHRMRRLFEAFVRNFYRIEQDVYDVVGNGLSWFSPTGTPEELEYLPGMRTDIHLRSTERRIVIETKFTPEPLQYFHGSAKLRSAHLYQLLVYLQNVRHHETRGRAIEGILLYPAVQHCLNVQLSVLRMPIRVVCIDLNQPWQSLRSDLLKLVGRDAESNAGDRGK